MAKRLNTSTTSKLEGDTHLQYIEHCKKGGSRIEFCAAKEIDPDTFDNWCKKYPHMQAARVAGKMYAEAWWTNKAKEHLVVINDKDTTTKFDTNLYKFIMGGRFGHTGDRNLRDELTKMTAQLESMMANMAPKASIAEEPEYEEEK